MIKFNTAILNRALFPLVILVILVINTNLACVHDSGTARNVIEVYLLFEPGLGGLTLAH